MPRPKEKGYRPDMTRKESRELYRNLYLSDLYREKAYYQSRGLMAEVKLIDDEIDRRTKERIKRVRG